jgi:hypothetical protein
LLKPEAIQAATPLNPSTRIADSSERYRCQLQTRDLRGFGRARARGLVRPSARRLGIGDRVNSPTKGANLRSSSATRPVIYDIVKSTTGPLNSPAGAPAHKRAVIDPLARGDPCTYPRARTKPWWPSSTRMSPCRGADGNVIRIDFADSAFRQTVSKEPPAWRGRWPGACAAPLDPRR